LGEVLQRVEEADTISVRGTVHLSWMIMGSDGNVEKGIGAGLSIDGAGLLKSGSGLGWGGWYKDYKTFHNRTVARTVSGGTPEVTAKVATLEDVGDAAPNLFDAPAEEGDSSLLRTIVVGEIALRKNLAPAEPVTWPALQDGPLQGVVTTEVVVDRSGKVRQLGSIISDNPGLSEAAGRAIGSMQFTPYLQDGVAVQVVSTITIPFKTARPPGVEAFDSARSYFERGRKIGFPAAGDGPSYVLHATFQARLERGVVEGRYVDTWKSDREWRREATVGDSRLVRARHGDNRYLIAEGPDAGWLRLVLKAVEPIPDLENFTFVEADWRIKREMVDGVNAIRVLAGYESPEGVLDPEQARGYWFDDARRLLKTFAHDLETRRRDFKEFGESQVAREIQVLRNGSLGLLIRVTDMSPAGTLAEDMFELHGHEWKKAFTDEAR